MKNIKINGFEIDSVTLAFRAKDGRLAQKQLSVDELLAVVTTLGISIDECIYTHDLSVVTHDEALLDQINGKLKSFIDRQRREYLQDLKNKVEA